MSWNDQDIDKLFKEAKAPNTPAFHESYWTEMEAMLPTAKRKKIGFWWVATSSVVAITVLTTVIVILQQNSLRNTSVFTQLNAIDQRILLPTPILVDNQIVSPENDEHAPTTNATPTKKTGFGYDSASCYGVRFESRSDKEVKNESIFQETDQLEIHEQVSQNTPNTKNRLADNDLTNIVILPPYSITNLAHSCPEKIAIISDSTFQCDHYLSCAAQNLTFPKAARFYIQASAGIGQSAQHVVGQSDLLHYYAIGGGLYKKIDRMVFTFGADVRVDFTKNILFTSFPDANTRLETKYSQLYSIELPVSMGYESGRNAIFATITPGFQTAFSGNQKEITNENIVRSEQLFGKVTNAKTLTMEIGMNYWRRLSPNWHMGLGINADILKPFNSALYAGKQRLLPLNIQFGLRRTF